MNRVNLSGRLTTDPETRYTQGESPIAVARYTLAVERRVKKGDEQAADFINCVVFRKGAEFAEKYLRKGMKIIVSGRIQTGSYTNKEGRKVYTTDIVLDDQEFAESKKSNDNTQSSNELNHTSDDGFMNIPDGIDEELPFFA